MSFACIMSERLAFWSVMKCLFPDTAFQALQGQLYSIFKHTFISWQQCRLGQRYPKQGFEQLLTSILSYSAFSLACSALRAFKLPKLSMLAWTASLPLSFLMLPVNTCKIYIKFKVIVLGRRSWSIENKNHICQHQCCDKQHLARHQLLSQ